MAEAGNSQHIRPDGAVDRGIGRYVQIVGLPCKQPVRFQAQAVHLRIPFDMIYRMRHVNTRTDGQYAQEFLRAR